MADGRQRHSGFEALRSTARRGKARRFATGLFARNRAPPGIAGRQAFAQGQSRPLRISLLVDETHWLLKHCRGHSESDGHSVQKAEGGRRDRRNFSLPHARAGGCFTRSSTDLRALQKWMARGGLVIKAAAPGRRLSYLLNGAGFTGSAGRLKWPRYVDPRT